MGTSHFLGQNFSKAFDIKFSDKEEKMEFAWQTSWGMSTRTIGAIIMVHGDDKGLVLPPKIAPIKAVIVPILFKENKEKVLEVANKIKKSLKIETELDDRDGYTAGWKFNEWEMKGVPIRIEIGPKDVEKNQAVIVRRDTGSKEFVSIEAVPDRVKELLKIIQKEMFEKAKKFLYANIVEAKTMDEMIKAINDKKIVKAYFCGSAECEDWIKDKTGGATTRCIPFKQKKAKSKCVYCEKEANEAAYFGKCY